MTTEGSQVVWVVDYRGDPMCSFLCITGEAQVFSMVHYGGPYVFSMIDYSVA